MGEEILSHLRDVFLAGRAPTLVDLTPDRLARAQDQSSRLGAAALVRSMERLGEALTDMREALDTRVALEVAIVRITAPEADASPAALLERLERLERRLDGGAVVATPAASPAAIPPAPPVERPAPPVERSVPKADAPAPAGQSGGRGALGAFRKGTPPPPPPPRSAQAAPSPAPASSARTTDTTATASTTADGDLPTRDELTLAWGDHILPTLRGRARALYSVGRFVSVEGGSATFALDNDFHRDQCAALQADVEAALAAHFGRRIPLRLVTENSAATPSAGDDTARPPVPDDRDDDETNVSVAEVRAMEAAPGVPNSPADRVKLAFPGATEVEGQP